MLRLGTLVPRNSCPRNIHSLVHEVCVTKCVVFVPNSHPCLTREASCCRNVALCQTTAAPPLARPPPRAADSSRLAFVRSDIHLQICCIIHDKLFEESFTYDIGNAAGQARAQGLGKPGDTRSRAMFLSRSRPFIGYTTTIQYFALLTSMVIATTRELQDQFRDPSKVLELFCFFQE